MIIDNFEKDISKHQSKNLENNNILISSDNPGQTPEIKINKECYYHGNNNVFSLNHNTDTYTFFNKQTNCIECTRNVSIKYLSPGHIKLPGAIIINQEQNVKLPQAPSVIMRQYPQIPCNIHDEPDTLVLREQPPVYPQVPQTKIVNLPGQLLLPGPDRKVIIERLPELPDSPQNIQIERWLPYKEKPRKIILNP
jgi:hypothetical protein